MAVTVQECLDMVVTLITRDPQEGPTDAEILFWMGAALKELQSDAAWPVLRVVTEIAVNEGDVVVTISNNVVRRIDSISYIYNGTRVQVTASDPNNWAVYGEYPTRFVVSGTNQVMFDVPFPTSGNIVCQSYQFLPLPGLNESNGLIDIAPQLIIAKTMLLLAPRLRMESSEYSTYDTQVKRAAASLNRWTAGLVGTR